MGSSPPCRASPTRDRRAEVEGRRRRREARGAGIVHRTRRRLVSFFNVMSRELCCKIVYYGPGLCGKTTNVERLYVRAPAENRGALISLKTESDRTLFFDYLPLEVGKLRGYRVRLHLYTVP